MNDIAPLFRKILSQVPEEALEEMEQYFLRRKNDKVIQLAIADIHIEKAKRQNI